MVQTTEGRWEREKKSHHVKVKYDSTHFILDKLHKGRSARATPHQPWPRGTHNDNYFSRLLLLSTARIGTLRTQKSDSRRHQFFELTSLKIIMRAPSVNKNLCNKTFLR